MTMLKEWVFKERFVWSDDVIMEKDFKTWKKRPVEIKARKMATAFSVDTPEGKMSGKKGDYLIIGIAGEMYPCDREIFENSYDFVSDEPKFD